RARPRSSLRPDVPPSPPRRSSDLDPRANAFAAALGDVLFDLALQVVRDGEGASKLVKVVVDGATSDTSAARIARSIANSPLVKTDRKSTRLNSSHVKISYAVFCWI